MTIEEVIFACLSAAPGLAGIPIRPDIADQDDKDAYVIYQQFAGRRPSTLKGDCGLGNPRFQIDVYTTTKLQTSALKDVVRKAILAEPLLRAVLVADGGGPPYEAETKMYRHRQDFSFWFYDQ
jgi:hypothetical protein